jgi:hypothetical protein
MIKYLLVTLLFLLFGCTGTPKMSDELKNFNDFLGKEKAGTLSLAVESFQNFLSVNLFAIGIWLLAFSSLKIEIT